jgi:hypothetical protein
MTETLQFLVNGGKHKRRDQRLTAQARPRQSICRQESSSSSVGCLQVYKKKVLVSSVLFGTDSVIRTAQSLPVFRTPGQH